MEKKWWVLLGTGIAAIMLGIDYSIVNTSLAPIQRELHATVIQLQWLLGGFGIFFVGLLMTAGRLGDIRGRRKFLYIGILGFAVASLGAGLSPSPNFLIAMRMLQGLFCAAIFPCGMALVSDAFPENERARALGMYSSFIGIGFVLGPVIGSLILSIASWRWIFFINLPSILVSFLICLPILHESKHPESPAVDWLGAFFLITCIGSLAFSISEGSVYGWSSTLIITTFIVAIVTLILFIIVEKRVDSPLMPLPLFMNSGFLLGMIIYMITAISWSIIFLMPLYLHESVNLSSALVGIVTFAMTIMTMIGPSVSGHYYGEKGPTLVTYAAFFLTIISLILFIQLRPHGPMWLIILSFFLFGSAWGSSNGIAIPLGLSKLPNVDDSGLVSGAMLTLMNIVGIMALAFDIVLFDYGHKTSFMTGLHLVCTFLLGLAIVLALAAITTLHLVYNRSKASSTG